MTDGDVICGREYILIRLPVHCTHCLASFVTLFWPKKVKAGKLEEIHAKMVMKEGAPRASSSDGTSAAKKPRLSAGASSRAGAPAAPSTSTTSSHTNGKHR